MRCARVVSLVDRYVDGALSSAEMAAIDAHAASCRSCASRIAAARRLVGVLAAEPAVRAPRGFADRVMEAVYRQQPAVAAEPRRRAAPMYRRLGLSFVITAAVLTASLLIPRVAYPSLVGGREITADRAVKQAMAGADSTVRGILGGQENGGTK